MNDAALILAIIPLLLVFMGGEALLARRRGMKIHSAGQTLNNIGVAIGQRALSSALGLVPLAGYSALVGRVGLFEWNPRSPTHWLAAWVALDFAMYIRHYAGHRIAFLWASHAVHHQSTEYNYTAATRLAWAHETLLFSVPLALLGLPLAMVLPLFGIANLYQFLLHTQLIGKLGWIDRVFMTPSNHRVHHGRNAIYIDKNHGNMLAIWDHLFGTYAAETEPVDFGTIEGLPSLDPLENNLAPIRALLSKAARQPTLREALLCFIMSPEWRTEVKPFTPAPIARRVPAIGVAIATLVATLGAALLVTANAAEGRPVAWLTLGTLIGLVFTGLILEGSAPVAADSSPRARLAAWVGWVAGSSTNGPLAWLSRVLTPRAELG